MTSKVLIFTKRVLPLSNTFVAAQGNNLENYEPIYIGLRNNQSGIELINGHPTCVQENYERLPAFSRFLLDGAHILTSRWQKALKKCDASIIHANFGKGGYYCTPIANKLNLPLVTTFHGSDITQKDKFSYNKKHRQVTFENSDKIIAVSKFIEKKLVQAGCPEEKIIQHYIGLDNQFFTPNSEKFTQPTILFVGRLIEQKGCQYLLQAMKIINQKLPEAKLIIAGYGNYQSKLLDLAKNVKNVQFIGSQNRSQIKELMSKAWLTCIPSIKMARGNEEALAMVSLESQAVGTPVVAFDTGGVGEGIIDKVTGLLCAEKDIPALAHNLLTLLHSDALRDEMAAAGINRVEQFFNIKKQGLILEQVYDSLR